MLLEALNEEISNGLHIYHEMATIGMTDDNYKITVYDGEGQIPHFHITKGDIKKPDFHTCINITKAEYFHHGNKQDTLNSKQRKDLVRFLKSTNKHFGISNWEFIVRQWNTNNLQYEIDRENLEMHNYSSIS